MSAQFIDLDGCFYSTADIRMNTKGETVLEFTDGETKTIPTTWWNGGHDAFLSANGSVVPAQPGFALLRYFEGDDSVERLAVVAWMIDPKGEEFATRPVTIDGVSNCGRYEAVLQPDGGVIRGGDTAWNSYEAWLASMKKGKPAAAESPLETN